MDQPKPDPNDERTFRTIKLRSTLQDAKIPEAEILKCVREHNYRDEDIFAIKLALEEAMTNAVKHGNACDESKGITVRFAVDAERVVIIVRDEGCGFCPENVPDPTSSERITLPNGRGIMLMNAYMDEVRYRADGCEVCLTKRNRAKSSEDNPTA